MHEPLQTTSGAPTTPAGYPFGATARWLLLAVFTEAVRRQSPEVDLGNSVTAFLRELGVATDGRRLRAVQEQMARLLAASIRFSFRDRNIIAGANRSIASDYLLWRRQSGVARVREWGVDFVARLRRVVPRLAGWEVKDWNDVLRAETVERNAAPSSSQRVRGNDAPLPVVMKPIRPPSPRIG